MNLIDELERLASLHRSGALSDTEFAQAKARLLGGASGASDASVVRALNQLQRSRADRWLGGVCGGVARMTGVATWIWRVLFVGLVFCAGTGLLAYLLLWLFVPEEAQITLSPRQLA